MTSRKLVSRAASAAIAVCAAASFASAGDVPASSGTLGDLRAVGTVQLKSSCGPEAQAGIERAAALLHSFFYEEARRGFADVAAKAPGCALAHWGVAMSYWHPIWTPPSDEEREAGRAAIARPTPAGGKTDIERGLIAALAAYYDPPSSAPAPAAAGEPGRSCHGLTGGADSSARALAYEKTLEPLFAAHPKDVEVGSFYALALLATASPTDASLKNPLRAAQILESLRTNASHPGVVHCLIRLRLPAGGARELKAARGHAAIAPWVPHALRMPAHIFRGSMWNDVIASNLASADAARQYAADHHPGPRRSRSCTRSTTWSTATCSAGTTARLDVLAESRRCARPSRPPTSRPPTRSVVPARCALERRQWAKPPRSSSRRARVAREVHVRPHFASRARSARRARAACRKRARRWPARAARHR
jgi:hypothetical protein